MPGTLSELAEALLGGVLMDVQLLNFTHEHLKLIEKWERTGEIYIVCG